jgi:hypothetical protein
MEYYSNFSPVSKRGYALFIPETMPKPIWAEPQPFSYAKCYSPVDFKQLNNNQGRESCFKCNTPTVKVSTGMFSVYDICPICKI